MSDEAIRAAERLRIYCERQEAVSTLAGVPVDPVVNDIRDVIDDNERMATIYENAVRLSATDCERVIEIGKRHFEDSAVSRAESMLAIVEMMSEEIGRLRSAAEAIGQAAGKGAGE